ncbi:MAG: fibronectin type III domain-containing protein [Candidatus Competibacter sp.]|nr:fibronectin type III domain-containing protein [Candidatus Competibacter sp.]MDG4584981.1 fibronectin type III domain-containing protein [Candidatus Competibacter sp.]
MQHQTLTWPRLLLAIALAWFGPIATAHAQAVLESPSAGAFVQSGVGLIRGWACQAGLVEISIDGGARLATAHGTDRPDTATVCGDRDNGFGLTYNWGEIGDGVHTLRAFADGVEFASVNFTVTTLGRPFLSGLRAQYTLRDFPNPGDSPQILWSEPHQNFVFIRRGASVLAAPALSPLATGGAALESPTQGSYESGVGLIRGWVCAATRVEISIDGGARLATAHGTDRPDTVTACGDRDNGFGLTYNWSRISPGTHNLRAFADGVEFANVNFSVASLGGEYLTGLSGRFTFDDFPASGQTTLAEWSEPAQNFIVARTTATPSRLALISAITDVLNPMAVAGSDTTAGESTGVRAAKRGDGQPTQLEGITWAKRQTGQSADLQLTPDGLPSVYTDSSGVEARFGHFDLAASAPHVTVSFFRNGVAQGNPATVLVDGGRLRALQTMAERVRQAVQSAPASTGRQLAPPGAEAASARPAQAAASRFTLNALLVNSYWYGSVAAGETLCAVRTAATQAGVSGLVAPDACQSSLIEAFLSRSATRRGAAAEPPASGIDPLVRQALQADADIPEAPCGPAGGGVSCLEPVATQLQTRQDEIAQTPVLPWEAPPAQPDPTPTLPEAPLGVLASDGTYPDRIRISWNPVAGATSYDVHRDGLRIGSPTGTSFDDTDVTPDLIYTYTVRACNSVGCGAFGQPDDGFAKHEDAVRSYSGSSTICFTATANYGAQGSCPQRCASAGASATLQNESLTLTRTSFSFTYNFDSRGSCTESTLTRSGDISYTPNVVNGSFSYSYSIYSGSNHVATVNMQGSYNDTSLSASGSTRYSVTLSNGQPATIDFAEDIGMKSSSP